MADNNRIEGQKALVDYFEASWKTVVKHLNDIKDRRIYYRTIAGKHVLIRDAYEQKHGSPKRSPELQVAEK